MAADGSDAAAADLEPRPRRASRLHAATASESSSSRRATHAPTAKSTSTSWTPTAANPKRLLGRPGFDGVPIPSPDGRWIAFQRGNAKAG